MVGRFGLMMLVLCLSAGWVARGEDLHVVGLGGMQYLYDVNDFGVVVGVNVDQGNSHGFRYDVAKKRFTDIHTMLPKAQHSPVVSVNDLGNCAGSYYSPEDGLHHGWALIDDQIVEIDVGVKNALVTCTAINNLNHVLVTIQFQDGSYETRVVIWEPGGTALEIGRVGYGHHLQAVDLNDSDSAVLLHSQSNVPPEVLLYRDGELTRIEDPRLPWDDSTPTAMNNLGEVVGSCRVNKQYLGWRLANTHRDQQQIAYLFNGYNYVRGFGADLYPLDINDHGQVNCSSETLWDNGTITYIEELTREYLSCALGIQMKKLTNSGIMLGTLGLEGHSAISALWVPESIACSWIVPGDSNCDGRVDFEDIDAFVVALTSACDYTAAYSCDWLCQNDVNPDDAVDFNDIDAFVSCLINGGCP